MVSCPARTAFPLSGCFSCWEHSVSLLASEMIQLDPFPLFRKLSSESLSDSPVALCVCEVCTYEGI